MDSEARFKIAELYLREAKLNNISHLNHFYAKYEDYVDSDTYRHMRLREDPYIHEFCAISNMLVDISRNGYLNAIKWFYHRNLLDRCLIRAIIFGAAEGNRVDICPKNNGAN